MDAVGGAALRTTSTNMWAVIIETKSMATVLGRSKPESYFCKLIFFSLWTGVRCKGGWKNSLGNGEVVVIGPDGNAEICEFKDGLKVHTYGP